MRIELLKPYGKEWGGRKLSAYIGFHRFEYGGVVYRSMHLWPFFIEFNPCYTDVSFLIRKIRSVINFSDGVLRVKYGSDKYGESWKVLQIGGTQETFSCSCAYDCCAHTFCNIVEKHFFGLVTIGHYQVNV
jgi:hypothetical protein